MAEIRFADIDAPGHKWTIKLNTSGHLRTAVENAKDLTRVLKMTTPSNFKERNHSKKRPPLAS